MEENGCPGNGTHGNFCLACLKLFLLCFIMKVVTFENYFCHRSLGLGVKELMVSRVGYCSEL